jgi:hypothetical protein
MGEQEPRSEILIDDPERLATNFEVEPDRSFSMPTYLDYYMLVVTRGDGAVGLA